MKLYRSTSVVCLTVLVAALAACGGGGGDATVSAPTTSTPTTLTVTGTAATGLAIAGATVTGKCKVGTGTATTAANGTFTLTVTDGQLPCVLQVTNPADSTKLHTLVFGAGNSAVANITPLTEMTTARVLSSEPNVFFAAFDATVVTQKVTPASVTTAQAAIDLVFTGTIDTIPISDFITTPLVAATQGSPTSGDAQDKLLDALKLKFTTAQLGTVTTALASNQTAEAIKQTVITMNAVPTTPPVANAGAAQSVVTGTTVTLDASTSSAAAGKSLTYAWTLTSKPAGSAATLAAPTTAKPTFVADVAGAYVASVIVNDGSTASSAAAVTVTASVANAAPVANAGVAQNVVAGSAVTLDGSASSDANSDALTYTWTLTSKPANSSAVLSSATSAKPTFTADVAGTYIASLTVNDGKLSSANATTTITAASAVSPLPVGTGTIAQEFPATKFYNLNEETGLLTALPNACQIFSAADLRPDGVVVAVSSLDSLVQTTDLLAGTCSTLFQMPEPMDAIAVAADGTVVTISSAKYFGAKQIYRFTAAGVLISKVAASGASGITGIGDFTSPGAIDFAPNGSLYAVQLGSIWLLDAATGSATLKAIGLAGTGDIDIDSANTLRTIDFGVLKQISTATWAVTSSRTLERDVFGFNPLVRR
ncbi:MAG: PKD domain-containing protein [Rhodoferax sp.]|nr:PKD domain-containing protein [Rhodoferax sp.]